MRAWRCLRRIIPSVGADGCQGLRSCWGTGPEGEAVIERAPGGASGSGSGAGAGAGAGGDMLVGADMTNLRFEVITGGPSEGASGSSSRETAS